MQPLKDKIALVAGATRGAGRGIARMLGEAGATVYCTGRTARGVESARKRPETIEETAEMVAAEGGRGIAVRVDHTDETQVAALVERIEDEQAGRLDILVNVLGGDRPAVWKPFWKQSLEEGLGWLRHEAHAHIITSRYVAALMVERKRGGLIVGLTDGDTIGYRASLFYDLVKMNTIRLAYAMAEELASHSVASVAVTPGFMRTEAILEHFGATEANWREVAETNAEAKRFGFIASETPCFVGRAVAALAADPRVMEKSGGLYGSWTLSEEYGFTDIDGNRPHLGRHFAEHFKHLVEGRSNTGFSWKIERDARPARATQRGKRAEAQTNAL